MTEKEQADKLQDLIVELKKTGIYFCKWCTKEKCERMRLETTGNEDIDFCSDFNFNCQKER